MTVEDRLLLAKMALINLSIIRYIKQDNQGDVLVHMINDTSSFPGILSAAPEI